MAGPTATLPLERKTIPSATHSLLALGFLELSRDLRLLLESRWAEPVRRRAEELSTTLADACERQGLGTPTRLLRVVVHLTQIPRSQALPLQAALRAKLEALLRDLPRALPRREIRISG